MGILIDKNTKVLVQGITGREGTYWTERMSKFGTNVVAGVTPGKGGQEVHGVPVFNSIREALENVEVDASIIFVPPKFTKDAAFEAIDAGLSPIVVTTDGVPPHDAMEIVEFAKQNNCTVIGANTPGLTTLWDVGKGAVMGFYPLELTHVYRPGSVGVVSRSGSLINVICSYVVKAGYGQTTVVGIGGDPVVGTSFVDILKLFQEDPETKAVVLVGEIGGTMEEEAAEYIKEEFDKPVIAWIPGRTAPPGKRMGHAGAIITGGMGTVESKVRALEKAGVKVARVPWEIRDIVKEVMGGE